MPSKKYMSKRYADYSYDEDAFGHEAGARFTGSGYSMTVRCRVPRGMLDFAQRTGDHSALDGWIESKGDGPEIWY
jgi:hypothetical protein